MDEKVARAQAIAGALAAAEAVSPKAVSQVREAVTDEFSASIDPEDVIQ